MFFITCFSRCERDEKGWPNMGAVRTFGFEKTFEDAEESLNTNRCDMFEYLYTYAVVEEMDEGIHPECKNRWFFKWDDEKQGFFRMEEPTVLKGFCNIALG